MRNWIILSGLLLTGCGTFGSRPSPDNLSVQDKSNNKVLSVTSKGKFKWHYSKDYVAEVLLGIIIEQRQQLEQIAKAVSDSQAAQASGKKPSKKTVEKAVEKKAEDKPADKK